MDFKEFPKIEKLTSVNMLITLKIHGTNASIAIYDETQEDGSIVRKLKTGSRTKWVTPDNDNYGFARFVQERKDEFIEKLGLGVHYGEFYGLGINSGEGMKTKQLALFDVNRYNNKETGIQSLPPQVITVPVLYQGPFSLEKIEEMMAELKEKGSPLVPGFMRPEGVVVTILGKRFKKVFDAEETAWKQGGPKAPKEARLVTDYGYLLQPIRLEKLLSRDEAYIRDYPKSLGNITKDYTNDLISEGQIIGDADEIKAITKGAAGQIFKFIKTVVEEVKKI